MTDNPMSFLAMQNKFLKELSYNVNVTLDRSGYKHVDYSNFILILENALEKAHELNNLEKERKALEEWNQS